MRQDIFLSLLNCKFSANLHKKIQFGEVCHVFIVILQDVWLLWFLFVENGGA